MTNAWICYKVYHKERNLKIKLTHYEFILSFCLAWIDEYVHWPDRYGNWSKRSTSPVTCKGRRKRADVIYASRFNSDITIPEGYLKRRLNSELYRIAEPLPYWLKDPSYQLHRWANDGEKCRKQILFCAECNVTLWNIWFKPFHTCE